MVKALSVIIFQYNFVSQRAIYFTDRTFIQNRNSFFSILYHKEHKFETYMAKEFYE